MGFERDGIVKFIEDMVKIKSKFYKCLPGFLGIKPFAIFTSLIIATSQISFAQEVKTNPFKFDDWTLECQVVGVNQTACIMSQTVLFKKTKRLYFKASLTRLDDKTAMMIEAPEGADLKVHPEVWFDDEKEKRKAQWAICFKGICRATLDLDSETVERMKKANKIKISYRSDIRTKSFLFEMSLKGFTKAYESLPIQTK